MCNGKNMKTQLTIVHNASRTFARTEPASRRKPVLALLIRLLWAAAFVLPVLGAQAAVVLTTLYSFSGGDDGGQPSAGLVQGRDGSFYGTTWLGGPVGAGTVFRLTILPEFQAVALTNGTLSLTWSTEAGGTHQVQYTSDLSSTNWTNLGSAVVATGATLGATDSVTSGPRRFYRVVLAP